MNRTDMTQYDHKPAAMVNYLRYYGPHFSQKLCMFAVRRMKIKASDESIVKINPMNKQDVDRLLADNGIEIENDMLYDAVFVCNMARADFLGSSIEDELHLARYVKDYIDDPDGYDGLPFNRWYADCCRDGIAIDWENMM